jgi:hypothetical protein
MVEEYYHTIGFPPRQSATLQNHFIELYSAFKLGIRTTSLVAGSMRYPSVFVKGEQETDDYVQSLAALLVSDGKRFHPKKWWSPDVVELLLELHLQYMVEFGSGAQSVDWLMGKAVGHKNKFETDQRSRETELARKRAAEEEELKEASKNRKMVAESSLLLVAALEKISNAATPVATPDIGVIVEEKMGSIQSDMMKKIDEKLDDKFASFFTVMQQMLNKNKD